MAVMAQLEDDKDETFTDDEPITPNYPSHKPDKLQINDFISIAPIDDNTQTSLITENLVIINKFDPKSSRFYLDDIDPSKQARKFHRQISREEKLYNRDKAVYLQMKKNHGEKIQPVEKSHHHLMSLSFRRAQCYPTKYLICLTDRLKPFQWTNNFDFFPTYSTLNSYLIIIVNDETSNEKNFLRVQVAIQNDEDNELSESEFLNKQIRHLQLLDKNQTQTKTILEEEQLNNDSFMDEYALIKSDICTSCYRDMDETIPMTAVKACAHWLCNECWKQHLENSIKHIKVVLCPEWNCDSIVDVGTILSLVNVRCTNIYERNIEKCLVNLSRSYIKCPSKSCSNIVQVVGSGVDHVRCRCGHQFCINCGCNHMTYRCGAEFCWSCTGYWKDHNAPDGTFRSPKLAIPLQEETLSKQHSQSRHYHYNAIYHRHERILQFQSKQNENAKRLLGTIPLDKGTLFDSTLIKSQIDKRESVLRHLYEMVKYIKYLHSICEFIADSADSYGNNPSEFRNGSQPLETIVFNMSQILEGGKGYKAIEQLKQLHASSEKIIERLRRAVTLRELR
ncbi:unnamed protein product [Rotaria sp. Silwood1]|nr:unnamed protein product [Rotaria sp. Silwood1]